MAFRVYYSRLFSIFFLAGFLNSVCSAFLLPQRRATASSLRSTSDSGTQDVGDEDRDDLSDYLSRNVEAVVLPGRLRRKGSTYPPLILDGASGTGKTQQAFALVKEHDTIIYFVMSDPTQGFVVQEQLVYRSMRELTVDNLDFRFAHRADEAIKALRESVNNKTTDICSVDFLRKKINTAKAEPIDYDPIRGLWSRQVESNDKGLDLLMDVVLWMCSKRLRYDKESGLRVDPIKHGDNTNVTFVDLCGQLKDIILFANEALPKRAISAGDRPDPVATDRLRFTRNLGRALTMRVVVAGTAATAANMIADPANAASRIAAGELAWIECQFLWKTMSENDVKGVVLPNLALPYDLQQEALISELARGRPYLVHLFGRVTNRKNISSADLPDVLEKVGDALQVEKDMSPESNLVYLLGVWLDQAQILPTAFPIKPADLVRGSFFEPCVVLGLDRNPNCGRLMGKRLLASGDQRIEVYCQSTKDDKRIMWCASMEDTNSEPRAAFCWDFSGIEYSLSACVQQCLAREPVLAVALSTQCRMTKAKFRKALSKLYQEPLQQRAADALDGELNEQVLFALLQLASNCKKLTEARVELGAFLRMIAEYLTNDSDDSFAVGVEEFCGKLANYGKPGPSQIRLDAILGTRSNEFKIDDQTKGNYKKCRMPWLVPAWSLEGLKKTVDGARSLFDGIDIAGLVPGVPQAPFDAAAYPWKKLAVESKDVVAKPEWVFEFRTRAGAGYTTDQALNELKEKCVLLQKILESEPKKARKKKTSIASDQADKLASEPKEKTKKKRSAADKLQCHAILIATTGGYENSCKISCSGEYLRVALVVGLGLKLLK